METEFFKNIYQDGNQSDIMFCENVQVFYWEAQIAKLILVKKYQLQHKKLNVTNSEH